MPFKDKEKRNKYNREWYNRNQPKIRLIKNKWRKNNIERLREHDRDRNLKIKTQVLDFYGNKCKSCGISNYRVLSIDHIYNNGAKHRKQINKKTGQNFYHWLKNNNFPTGYQTLCMNCNILKGWESNKK